MWVWFVGHLGCIQGWTYKRSFSPYKPEILTYIWLKVNILLTIRISRIHVFILNLIAMKQLNNMGLNQRLLISSGQIFCLFALLLLVLNSTSCAVLWRSKQVIIGLDSLRCLLNFPEEFSTSFIYRCFFPCTAYEHEDYSGKKICLHRN